MSFPLLGSFILVSELVGISVRSIEVSLTSKKAWKSEEFIR